MLNSPKLSSTDCTLQVPRQILSELLGSINYTTSCWVAGYNHLRLSLFMEPLLLRPPALARLSELRSGRLLPDVIAGFSRPPLRHDLTNPLSFTALVKLDLYIYEDFD